MLVLGIESSCDDTAAAIVEDGTKILSSVISDQNTIHSIYGGVVPELAGRSHVEVIDKVIKQALKLSEVSLEEIDLIAVTKGPGLVSSLLVGINTAKALAYALQIPLIGVNHLEGHLLAIFLQEPVKFPFIALTVSGGHTDLYRVNGFGEYIILGRTRDDAAGEAFDKVAKMLNLGYPGGPIVEKKAKLGDSSAYHFPRAFLEKNSLDFSFSGLKTSVRNIISKREELSGFILSDEDIAASFQSAVLEVLSTKLVLACKQQNINRVVVTGGVAANQALRQKVKVECDKNDFQCFFPNLLYCTDNAAMIACAGYYNSCNSFPVVNSFLSLDASSVKSL